MHKRALLYTVFPPIHSLFPFSVKAEMEMNFFCLSTVQASSSAHCLKITQNVAFEFWHFPPIFVLLKLTCLVTLFDRKLQIFKKLPKWTILGIFN